MLYFFSNFQSNIFENNKMKIFPLIIVIYCLLSFGECFLVNNGGGYDDDIQLRQYEEKRVKNQEENQFYVKRKVWKQLEMIKKLMEKRRFMLS